VDFTQILKKISSPAILGEKEQFLIKFAETEEEIEETLRLRYRVFNLEQGKGLNSASSNGIDRDEFDKFCLHLMVVEKKSASPVGTYRIHLGPVANAAMGFYSAREYHIKGLESIAAETIEVGRSCVAPEYRNGAVVALLWGGIGEVLLRSKLKYLIGCVSLETTEPAAGWGLYRYFQMTNKICDILSASPSTKYRLPQPSEAEMENFLAEQRQITKCIPPLFKGYLRLGAKVCGEPVLDREFGTIDFLILLNTAKLPSRYSRHFNVEK